MSSNISVVIPAYNRSASIERAIDSVRSQTLKAKEIIIVDDCSTDSTSAMDLLRAEDIHYIRHESNMGASAARNTGIRRASGNWVAFLDSDDIWLSNKLERQMEFINDYNLKICCTDYLLINRDGKEKGNTLIRNRILDRNEFIWGCYTCPGSTMIVNKSLFEEYGYYDETMRRLEDWDWLLRVSSFYKVGNLDTVLSVIQTTDYPGEDAVYSSLEIMQQKYLHSNILSSKEKRYLRAGMAMESARMAWLSNNYPILFLRLIQSLWNAPVGNKAFKTVITRKLKYGL